MLRIRNIKARVVFRVTLSLLSFTLVGIVVVLTPKANATDAFSWISSDPAIQVKDESYAQHNYNISHCSKQQVRIGSSANPKESVCVYQEDGFRYGIVSQQTGKSFVIGFPGDSNMYTVSGLPTDNIVRVPGSKHLVYRSLVPGSSTSFYLYIVKNLPMQITRIVRDDLSTGYQLKTNAAERLLHDEHGGNVESKAADASSNGRWLVVQVFADKLVRVNMETFDLKLFSTYGTRSSANIEFAVSDNGKFVATTGSGVVSRIHELSDQCGQSSIPDDGGPILLLAPADTSSDVCPEKEIQRMVENAVGDNGQIFTSPRFNTDGGELTLRADKDSDKKWVILTANSYTASSLDYLALGDSYSSGEGDTEKNPATGKKYYRDYTDSEENIAQGVPREKCHTSTRSYPYLLARGMNLALDNPKQWNTVACSGAITKDVYDSTNSNYLGQGGRLTYYNNIQDLKNQALNEMIPGRERQIEFVKKYQPKVITLTMGGNDIGFADKLRSCVSGLDTCNLVSKYHDSLASEIFRLYDDLKTLYEKLHDASGSMAKIYVIGYPQFISGTGDSPIQCSLNVGALNFEERKMITNSVTFLNNVIEKAAISAGVKYINIEDSLEGHKLCDSGEKYVTGIAAFGKNESQESFHPNAQGHDEIAKNIQNHQNTNSLNLLDYDICPNTTVNKCPDDTITQNDIDIPSYFQDADLHTNVRYKKMTSNEQIRDIVMNIATGLYSLAPNSTVHATIHSDPIDLGEYPVNHEGNANINLEVPSNLPAGYHTLTLDGTSYSGEPVEYEQTILIKGSDSNDIDEDGIPDTADKCLFITPANIDADSDGIDDACDPEIGVPKEPYRIRAGVAANSEDPQRFYIERNVYATDKTGVSGDNDPNNDGWAIVASSLNIPENATYARFRVDDNQTPHVSVRTPEDGCTQYKPSSLAKVVDNSPRLLTQEAKDTSTCREQLASADLDNEGTPDNTQPLYRARNGDSSKGEDPARLYLERSTRAAEAQLGKSDYAASSAMPASSVDGNDYREPWSLLATTPNTNISAGTFKRIITSDGKPYIVASHKLFNIPLCLVYKPSSLATIKQSTQETRRLQIDSLKTLILQLQGGCNE